MAQLGARVKPAWRVGAEWAALLLLLVAGGMVLWIATRGLGVQKGELKPVAFDDPRRPTIGGDAGWKEPAPTGGGSGGSIEGSSGSPERGAGGGNPKGSVGGGNPKGGAGGGNPQGAAGGGNPQAALAVVIHKAAAAIHRAALSAISKGAGEFLRPGHAETRR